MDINTLIKAINFITETKFKNIKENEQKTTTTFTEMKTNLQKAIKNNCKSSYNFLIKNNLFTEEDNEDTLFGFHFNNINKSNIDIANQFEDCVKDLSTEITNFLENMNSKQDKLDHQFINCKISCVDEKITSSLIEQDLIINCLEHCYNDVIKSHNTFSEEYIDTLNSYILKFK
jgi:hypothetical protein